MHLAVFGVVADGKQLAAAVEQEGEVHVADHAIALRSDSSQLLDQSQAVKTCPGKEDQQLLAQLSRFHAKADAYFQLDTQLVDALGHVRQPVSVALQQ